MSLKIGVAFILGCSIGAGGMYAAHRDAGPEPGERIRVAGVEKSNEPLPEMVPQPLEGRSGDGRRKVAREALAVTAWIRGDGVYGAGIVISEHHVLTCWHVVEKMKEIRISVAESPFMAARVLEHDAELDLAVLHVESTNGVSATIASAVAMEMGDPVYAMGAPRNMNFTLSSGIVSYAGRPYADLLYLQTDIPTNGGSSGGPVLDERGQVVGISSFILRDSQGLAFALPVDYAYKRFPSYFSGRIETTAFEAWIAERRASTVQHPVKADGRQPAPSPE